MYYYRTPTTSDLSCVLNLYPKNDRFDINLSNICFEKFGFYCLYIKELITGDAGRTDPCVSKLVNAEVKTLELDVLDVITREF